MNTDTLTTKDRYPNSPTFGENPVSFVALWDEPFRSVYTAEHMTGALADKTVVTVNEYRVYGSLVWAHVQAHQGGQQQAGWCYLMFLENAGAEYLREVIGASV